jgi:uncharacterized phage-associated protein
MATSYYKVEDIAVAFAHKAKADKKASLTHKKLQKLLYYAQAWSLVFHDKELFKEPIEAWVHGPVVPSLYHKFKKFGYNHFELADGVQVPDLKDEDQQVIDSVWNTYGKYDGDYLEMLTHNEEPWINARAGMESFEPCNNEISLTAMKEYYGKKLQEKTA